MVTVATLSPDAMPEAGRAMLQRYSARYGEQFPDPYAVQGYEAMRLVLDAVAAVGPRRRAVIRWLHDVGSRQSVLGTYSFDRFGDTTLRDYGLYRIRGGQLRVGRRGARALPGLGPRPGCPVPRRPRPLQLRRRALRRQIHLHQPRRRGAGSLGQHHARHGVAPHARAAAGRHRRPERRPPRRPARRSPVASGSPRAMPSRADPAATGRRAASAPPRAPAHTTTAPTRPARAPPLEARPPAQRRPNPRASDADISTSAAPSASTTADDDPPPGAGVPAATSSRNDPSACSPSPDIPAIVIFCGSWARSPNSTRRGATATTHAPDLQRLAGLPALS